MQALPTALRVLPPAPFPLRSLASLGIAQQFFSATAGEGIVAAAGPMDKSGAIAGDRTLTVFVKREGSASWAKVKSAALDVADLTKAIVAELPSLQGQDLDTLTLHVARDKAGKDVGDALDSNDTLAAVDLLAGAKIVIKVAGAAAAAGTAPGKKSASPLARALFSKSACESSFFPRTRVPSFMFLKCSALQCRRRWGWRRVRKAYGSAQSDPGS